MELPQIRKTAMLRRIAALLALSLAAAQDYPGKPIRRGARW